jgi:hypothetical protein
MTMKRRIVLFNPDHTNTIFVLKPKMMVDNKNFKYDNCQYQINDEHFQITTSRAWWSMWLWKRYYSTYYFKRGSVNPIPVPDFKGILVKSGVEGSELAAIFDPWFLKVISQPARDLMDNLQFYVSVGTLIGVAYLIWKMHTGQSDGSESDVGSVNP